MRAAPPRHILPPRKALGSAGLIGLLLTALLLGLPVARQAAAQGPAQVTAPPTDTPPLPTGDGTLRGQVVQAGQPGAGADLPMILYALRPDGSPGLGQVRTDAEGRYEFRGIDSDPGVLYLLGTRVGEVPFGMRARFEPGQSEIELDVKLSPLSADASGLVIAETVFKLDWVGGQLLVEELYNVRNPGPDVIYVPPAERAGREPVFRATLPDGVVEFMDRLSGLGDGLERSGDQLAYWGPIYLGDQEVSYRYLLDAPLPASEGGADQLELRARFPSGTGGVQVLAIEGGPDVSGAGLRPEGEPTEIEGVRYRSWVADGVAPGEELALAVAIPETSSDAAGISLSRADFWVDLDDTSMRITANFEVQVDASTHLRAAPGQSLLRFGLPEGAELTDLGAAARALGIRMGEGGDILLYGPIPPGRTPVNYGYRVPVRGGEPRLDIQLGAPVALLNVLIADVGLAVKSDRLHTRRPFRQGTRTYLHRQAYQVEADEPVRLSFRERVRSSFSRTATVSVILATLVLSAGFLIAPLWRSGSEPESQIAAQSSLHDERERIYAAIRDIEHDHETGKLDDDDFERLRQDLRGEAVELLREERSGAKALAGPPAAEAEAEAPVPSCPSCGVASEPGWQFCARCGATLAARAGAAE